MAKKDATERYKKMDLSSVTKKTDARTTLQDAGLFCVAKNHTVAYECE